MIRPPHPGETIKEDYLVPLGISVSRLARALGVGAARMNESCAESGASPPTQHSVWRATLGLALSSG